MVTLQSAHLHASWQPSILHSSWLASWHSLEHTELSRTHKALTERRSHQLEALQGAGSRYGQQRMVAHVMAHVNRRCIYETDLGVNLAGRSRRIGHRLISLTQADRFSHESGNLFSTPCSPPARVFSSRASCNATCLATSSRNSYKLHDHDEVHVPVPR